MENSREGNIGRCTFWLNLSQVAHINKLLQGTSFRFTTEEDWYKNFPHAKALAKKRIDSKQSYAVERTPRSRGRRSSMASSKNSDNISSLGGKIHYSKLCLIS